MMSHHGGKTSSNNNQLLVEAMTELMDTKLDAFFNNLHQMSRSARRNKKQQQQIPQPRRPQEKPNWRSGSARDDSKYDYHHRSEQRSIEQNKHLQDKIQRQRRIEELEKEMLETLNAFTNSQKKSPANRQPIGTEETKKRSSCPEEKLAIQEPESNQPLPICNEPEMLQEKAESNIKQNTETQPDTSVQEQTKNKPEEHLTFPRESLEAKFDFSIIQYSLVSENKQACEKLTQLEPVHPSSIVSFSQIHEENSSREEQRSLSLAKDMEQLPEPVLMPIPSYYSRKHCKDIELVRIEPNLFVLVSAEEEKRFGLERVKEFRVSDSVLRSMLTSLGSLKPETLLKMQGLVTNEHHEILSSLNVSKFSDITKLIRARTEPMLHKTFTKSRNHLESESNVLYYKNVFKHHHKELFDSSRTFDVFSLVFVKAHEKQVKDATSNTRRSYDFTNPFDYGSKEYLDPPWSKMKESKESKARTYLFGVWNWKYLRKTTAIAKGCSTLKYYFLNVYFCSVLFFVSTLFPFEVGDLDLRSNPFQVEGDDMILQEQAAEEELEHELDHTSFNSIELATTHGINLEKELKLRPDEALIIITCPMTCSRAKNFKQDIGGLLKRRIKPPDLEVLSHSFFVRTGVAVVTMLDKKPISYFRMIFEVGEQVWVWLKKKRFLAEKMSKQIDSTFSIIRRVNQNAYQLELQGKYNLSSSFEVSDLVLSNAEISDLRSNPFQVGEDDVILESTKDLECGNELEPVEQHEARKQLEPEEQNEPEDELVAAEVLLKKLIKPPWLGEIAKPIGFNNGRMALVVQDVSKAYKDLKFPVVLNGNNYLLWKRTTMNVLGGRGLTKHIESTYEEAKALEESLVKETWTQEDLTVLSALHCSLEASLLEGYSYCETSKELWDTLANVFGNESNLTTVYELKKTLGSLSQEDNDFNTHFGKYRSLVAELEMLRPFTTEATTLKDRREQDRVFGLLMTLNPTYTDVIQHILRDDKIPTLEQVCAKIQKEFGSQGLFGVKGENLPTANKAGFVKHKDKKALVCEHCNKKGHAKEDCWILHPHLKPEKFKNLKPKANVVNASNGGQENEERAIVQYGQQEKALQATIQDKGCGSSSQNQETIVMNKADLESLIQSIASKFSTGGISLFTSNSYDPKSLVLDSGASNHMISNPKLLENIKPALGSVKVANGHNVPIEGIGSINLFSKRSSAFYMPKFTSNLLSVKKTTRDLNCLAIFSPNDVKLQDIKSGNVFGQGGTKDDLYVLEDTSLNSISNNVASYMIANNVKTSVVLWHNRLGHPHSRALNLLLPGFSYDCAKCEACILGKHCKVVFPKSNTIYEKCFDLVHSDVWTSPCASRDNHKYFVTFIDEKSKYTWVTLLPSKDRVYDAFINFQNYVTNHFDAKIKILRTDNGGEYTSTKLKTHLEKCGILHQTSCPYNPQQNGVAERKNRHLMEVARAMLFEKHMPKRFWGDAVLTSCYLINRIPTRILNNQSPFQVLNNQSANIDHLKVFGSVCFVFVPGDLRNKLEPKSTKCVFIGYSTTQKGYKCYDPVMNRYYVSRDVKFMEDEAYFGEKNWEGVKDLPNSTSDRAKSLRHILEHLSNGCSRQEGREAIPNDGTIEAQEGGKDIAQEKGNDISQVASDNQQGISREERSSEEVVEENPSSEGEVIESSSDDEIYQAPQTTQDPIYTRENPRRSKREKKSPSNWKNTRVYYNCQAVAHPIQATCSIDLLPKEHKAFISKLDVEFVPQRYEEAKGIKEWDNAVDDEVQAMLRNHTWDEEELPQGKKCVSSKWVFTIKYKSNGDIERYKARLVARGFTQTYGDDYRETFAPVAKQHTVKVVLSLAVNLDWELWQMDVKNAFLQGELEEEVYMTPPPGLENLVASGKVLRLRKAIYGLKQSPRAWYHKLSSTLKANGFKKSESDHTLFTLQNDQGIVVVLIYVDDLIISGSNKEGIKSIKTSLHNAFDIKDLGVLKYFLGIEVCRSPEGLFLSQRKYTLDLLKLTGKLGAKPVSTPLEPGYKVNRKGEKDDRPYHCPEQYRRLVGKLIYLTYTRPDISFAVNQVSQHMKEPTVYHWSMVDRILKYLKGSPGQGIWMGKNSSTEIVGYCDADYGGDRNDRHSTTGFCTFIGGNLVTWKSKKQKVVSCSSAEAEYRAMKKLTNELTWLKALLKDFGIEQKTPITFHCDNQAAIHIANNPVFHERTKHVEIDCHKTREKIEDGTILPCYTESSDQLADIFTKAASTQVCKFIHGKLGLVDLTHP
ncbi:Reverse transcriptase RNA-dependent DNA polymerase [Arabidopsis thaliana x Arabidopsis arenosa]|uniref:Reverse transcriptase RNA-dependent DNA polymerase n=1 Tax=Arabidopsis thaliana x Arabidopsis arenosa TaxID=1240361 RepID=A0A8T2AXK3_9BRAS|nr:Reverse transcriptase RNA-dependent DNA polymerase [Arabidopsis thaliana x Arabidopsis arenosa]